MPRLYDATSVPSVVAIGMRKSPLRVLAVHRERPGEADRDLRHAGEVLDVAARRLGRERILVEVRRVDVGVRLDEGLPRRDDGRRQVVFLVVRNRHRLFLRLVGNRVLDVERQLAKGLRVEGERELVLALLERDARDLDEDRLAQWKRHRRSAADVASTQRLTATVHPHPVERRRHAVDGNLRDAGQGCVAQPILQAESHTVPDALEAAERIQLAQNQLWNVHDVWLGGRVTGSSYTRSPSRGRVERSRIGGRFPR